MAKRAKRLPRVRRIMLANLLVQDNTDLLRCCQCLEQRAPGFYWGEDGFYVCSWCTLPRQRQRDLNQSAMNRTLSIKNIIMRGGRVRP